MDAKRRLEMTLQGISYTAQADREDIDVRIAAMDAVIARAAGLKETLASEKAAKIAALTDGDA